MQPPQKWKSFKDQFRNDIPSRWSRERQIDSLMPIADYLARHYYNQGLKARLDRDDLFAIAAAGICQAVDTFKTDRNAKLITWAVVKSRSVLLEAIRNNRLEPRSMQNEQDRVQWVLFSTIGQDGKNTMGDWFGDNLRDVTQNTEATVMAGEERRMLTTYVERLPERERFAVSMYLTDRATYKDIAVHMKISESRVFQIFQQAVKRMAEWNIEDCPESAHVDRDLRVGRRHTGCRRAQSIDVAQKNL